MEDRKCLNNRATLALLQVNIFHRESRDYPETWPSSEELTSCFCRHFLSAFYQNKSSKLQPLYDQQVSASDCVNESKQTHLHKIQVFIIQTW